MVFSISNALIFEAFPVTERGRALGYLGSVVAIGALASPVVGGGLVEALGWEYVFFINLPIGAVVVAAALRVLPRAHVRPDRFSFDLPGAVALGAALGGPDLLPRPAGRVPRRSTRRPSRTPSSPLPGRWRSSWSSSARRPRSWTSELFAEPLYVLPVVAMLLYFVAAFMLNLVGPFYFEGVMGFSPATVGLVFLLLPAVMAVTAPVAGWLYDRTRFPYLAATGMGLVSAGYVVAGYAAAARLLVPMLGAFLVIGLGAGLFQAPNNTAQMSAVPRRWLGLASAITATGRNLGMVLGVSIGSVLLTGLLLAGGNTGPVLEADPALLASSVGLIVGVGAVLTGLSAGLSALRGVKAARALAAGQPVQP